MEIFGDLSARMDDGRSPTPCIIFVLFMKFVSPTTCALLIRQEADPGAGRAVDRPEVGDDSFEVRRTSSADQPSGPP